MKRNILSLLVVLLSFLCIGSACGKKGNKDVAPSKTEAPHEDAEEGGTDSTEEAEHPTLTEPPNEDNDVNDYKNTDVPRVNMGTVEEYIETDYHIMENDIRFNSFEFTENGELYFIQVGGSGITPWVEKGGKESKLGKGLNKFIRKLYKAGSVARMVDKSKDGCFYVMQYEYDTEFNKTNKSILHEVTIEGEILYSYDFIKIINENKVLVTECYPIGNHEVVIKFASNNDLYRFSIKNGRLSKYGATLPENAGIWGFFDIEDKGKRYIIDWLERNITVRDAESGAIIETIDYTPFLANLAMEDFYEESWKTNLIGEEPEEWEGDVDEEDWDESVSGGKRTLESQPPSLDVYDGKLYAAYITGIYVWNEQENTWDMVVDAYKDRMDLRKMAIRKFKVVEDGLFYCMGTPFGGESDGAESMFYEYRKK